MSTNFKYVTVILILMYFLLLILCYSFSPLTPCHLIKHVEEFVFILIFFEEVELPYHLAMIEEMSEERCVDFDLD